MQSKLLMKIFGILFLIYTPNSFSAPPVCGDADFLFPIIHLKLIGSETDKNNDFIGTFELTNNSAKPAIFIPIHKYEKDNFIEYPSTSVEFLDLNGSWVSLFNNLPGTYLSSKTLVRVNVNSKIIFKARLFSNNIHGLSGSDFRLLLKLAKPKICAPSYTFRVFPQRLPATHIEPIQIKQQEK